MKTENEWDAEMCFLAENWQPIQVQRVIEHYRRKKAALRSAKAAFADTYEVYFINPRQEDFKR